MLMVLSPAKTLDYESPLVTEEFTQPDHLVESRRLIARLRKFDTAQIATLMSLSDKPVALNVARYARWKLPFTTANARQAVLAFAGDLYEGLAVRVQLPRIDRRSLGIPAQSCNRRVRRLEEKQKWQSEKNRPMPRPPAGAGLRRAQREAATFR